MITAIYSFFAMGNLRGLELWIGLWVGCPVLYFILFSLFPKNRTKVGFLHLSLHFLVAEIVLDLLCGIWLWKNPAFLEYGAGITYGIMIFAVFLAISGIISTFCRYGNTKQNQE